MDENKLKETLSHLHAPEPSKEAQNQAVAAAMAVFDKKLQEKTQGKAKTHRPTSINPFNLIRRFYMKKKYVLSGVAGAVSVAAIAAVLGTPFFTEQMSRIQPVSQPIVKTAPKTVPETTVVPLKADADQKARMIAKENFLKKEMERVDEIAVSPTPMIQPQDQLQDAKENMPDSAYIEVPQEARMAAKEKSLQNEMEDSGVISSKPTPQKWVIGKTKKPAIIGDLRDGERIKEEGKADPTKKTMDKGLPSPSMSVAEGLITGRGLIAPFSHKTKMMDGRIRPQSVTMNNTRLLKDEAGQAYYKDVGRDKFEHADENSVKIVAAEPVSTFSIDVDTASYTFARKKLNRGVLPQKNAIRVEEMINYFDYNYPVADSKEQPFKPTIAVYDSPWKSGNKILHIGIKGYDIAPAEKPKSNLVFLLDVSGSMNSPDKLPLLKNSLKMLLDSLNPDDTVGIVVYAGSAGTVLEPTKASEKHKIIEALERLKSGGSTAGAEGIRQAYNLAERSFVKDGVNRVILATDGDFNVGITNQKELKDFIERKRDTGISLSVLGFGAGNYNDSMMQALAQNGNGNAAYIDTLSEARKVLVQEASSTLFTIAKDVKIQVEFNKASVKEYRLIGYETRALKREDFNNDKVDAGEIGSGHSVTALYEITPSGAPTLVDDLRYAEKQKVGEDKKVGNEYAFLKIRYKLPKEDVSKLIERPVTVSDEAGFNNLPNDIRFAASVAGFGQLLKGGKYTGKLTYDQVIEIANNARGKDTFGYRTEFINLVRLAKSAAAMQP